MCETGKKGSRMHRCVRGIMHLFKRCPRNTYSIKFLSTGICKTNVNMNRKENWLTLQMHHFYVQPKMCTASHPNHTNLPDMCWKCAGCSFVYMLLAFCAMFVPGSRSWSRDCTWGSAGTCFFLGIFKAYSHIKIYKELGLQVAFDLHCNKMKLQCRQCHIVNTLEISLTVSAVGRTHKQIQVHWKVLEAFWTWRKGQ
jgi:hypothetical protein